MNFLTLCDTLIKESGVEESGIASVVSQQGTKKKVVDWISRAWVDIQNKRDWNFLWAEGTFDLAVGKKTYDPVTDAVLSPTLKSWLPYTMVYTSGGTRYYLRYVPWGKWDYITTAVGHPQEFTIRPDNSLKLNASPDTVGSVSFEYIREPQILAGNTDEPLMPPAHHALIIYQALVYLAAEQDAPELYQDAVRQLETRMADLAASQLPNITTSATPLA